LLLASDRWKLAYPGAVVGAIAVSGVANPESSPSLDARKESLESQLRSQYASHTRNQLKSQPSLQPYVEYYGRYGKTYHLQLQLESVVFKGKTIPRVAALVEAMFMAELSNLILTAGHDLDSVQGQVGVDVAAGGEEYVTLSGQAQALKKDDMFICDGSGILSSVLYGPDHRTRITPATRRALFTTYAPSGIGLQRVQAHFDDLLANILTFAPHAQVEDVTAIVAG
jgi:DNA/RNA-binding domain of Phe-tRNA-synthetase-like protein